MVEVRSVVLAAGILSGTTVQVIVRCQAGLTLVVKRIDLWNPFATTTPHLWVTRSTQAASIALMFTEIAINTGAAWVGWVTLMPDDVLHFEAGSGGSVYYWISGTALHGVETVYQPVPSPGRLPYLPDLVPGSGGEPKVLTETYVPGNSGDVTP